MEIKSGKMIKSLHFFFQNYSECVLSGIFFFFQILFNLACMFAAHYEKKLCSCVFLRSLLITYLVTVSLKKESIILVKSLEKVLNCGSQNPYEPCRLFCSNLAMWGMNFGALWNRHHLLLVKLAQAPKSFLKPFMLCTLAINERLLLP